MGQGLAGSGNVNQKWAEQHNERYAERLRQTGAAVDQEKLKSAAQRSASQTSAR